MNLYRNQLLHIAAGCLLSVMAFLTSCEKNSHLIGDIETPDGNTQYILQPPVVSIEPFGGNTPATRAAVSMKEEQKAFNIGEELGNIITLGNSEVEDIPQTRALANGTYYRIVVYKLSEWNSSSPRILEQRLCKIGSTKYFADAGDITTPINLYRGDYRIFCYSFNQTTADKLPQLAVDAVNVPLADGDDFLSSDIISKNITAEQLGTNVELGTITLKHRCCRLIGTLAAEGFPSAGINDSPAPSLSLNSTFYTSGTWSIKNPSFSGGSTTNIKKFSLVKSGNTYTGTLILLPPSTKSLSADYSFLPNKGETVSVSNKSITTNATFKSNGSYSFTIKAVAAYVLTTTNPVQVGSYKWAYANLNNNKVMETYPWVSGKQGGSDNDYWRWNVFDTDTSGSYPPSAPSTWATNTDPCRKMAGSWQIPPKTYFDELVKYALKSNKVYINNKFFDTNAYGWVSSGAMVGCVFVDLTRRTCIFLPAAGFRYGNSYNGVGERGDYWSATNNSIAYNLYFDSGACRVDPNTRDRGRSLRCVQQ